MIASRSMAFICLGLALGSAEATEPATRPAEASDTFLSAPATRPAEADDTFLPAPATLLGLPAAPLEEPIITDRPDFTESPETVPFGHVQLEMGYTMTLEREFNHVSRDHTLPEFLLRVGIVKNFELRFIWEGYSYTRSRDIVEREMPSGRRSQTLVRDWDQGGSDLAVGSKLKLFDQDKLLPNFAVMTELSVPSGSTEKTSGDVEPGVVLLYSWDLTDRLSLSGNTGCFILREDSHQFLQTTQSLSLGVGITERIGAYLEYFVIAPDAMGTDCAHSANTGLTYLLTDNIQIDWRIGMGLNERAPDFFTGVGLSWRF